MAETSVHESANTEGTSVQVEAPREETLDFDKPLPPEYWPQIDHLVTEDDTPVDNIFSERQQRLLVEPLHSSWRESGQTRPFLALANVGLFYSVHEPPLVPDVLLSLDVQLPTDLWAKHNRSYFIWHYGKPPEIVIEIVSNLKGEETGRKLQTYARVGVGIYVIFDPGELLKQGMLNVYERRGGAYEAIDKSWLPGVELGLTLWHGEYEGFTATWLRWCDRDGNLIPTGAEWAEQERQKTEQERQRAEKLAAQLRALGVEPEEM
jgi:Uma2 family endonuclease